MDIVVSTSQLAGGLVTLTVASIFISEQSGGQSWNFRGFFGILLIFQIHPTTFNSQLPLSFHVILLLFHNFYFIFISFQFRKIKLVKDRSY